MGLYYQSGFPPSPLPPRIRLADGTTRTSLNEYDDTQLATWGLIRAPVKPTFDPTRQVIDWIAPLWVARDKTPEELEAELIAARDQAKSVMLDWIEAFLAPFTEGTVSVEPLSWDAKSSAAKAVVAGESHEHIPALQAEIEASGETLEELAAAILEKESYRIVVGFTTGLRRKTIKEIEAASLADIPNVLEAAKTQALAKAVELGIAS